MTCLDVQSLQVDLDGRTLVRDVSLRLAPGDLVGLIGPNGAGKSTLVRALAGVIPARGRLLLEGVPLPSLSRRERARRVAYLPQERGLSWPLTVREVVALGRVPHGGDETDPAVDRALAATGLEAFAGRLATRLSGGERARVLLARALAVEAPVLLADEPVAALDPHHALAVLDLLRRHARAGTAVLVVLHDLVAAARFCDRVLLLDAGALVAEGPPDAVLTPPILLQYYAIDARFPVIEGKRVPVPWRLP
ncbi:ABC transporter ATP-binding protein [Pararhodospirillum photometricum]|uniref:ABC transporter ATP-binding protein n=1 Tax=Pararhodospirillum photometricum TaxID=1084 RepID=UPI0003104AB0|nr:ABC transporter ATP-binding protein [Pararhodospirillum photometricum]